MAPYVSSRNTRRSIAGRVQAQAGVADRRARPAGSQSARPPKKARNEGLITPADFERAQDDFRSQAGVPSSSNDSAGQDQGDRRRLRTIAGACPG